MERLIISKKYPVKFIYNYIPNIFRNIAKQRLLIHRKSLMNKYLVDNYQLGISDIISLLKTMRVDEYESFYIIHFDADDFIKTKKTNICVRELLHLVSYGNLKVKGLHVIDGTFDYIAGNIAGLYRLFIFEEQQKLTLQKKRKDLNKNGN